MLKISLNIAAIITLSSILACGSDGGSPKPELTIAQKCGVLDNNESCQTLIQADGYSEERYFILNVPESLPESPALFISLHGSGGKADRVASLYQFRKMVADAGYIGAFANATIRNDGISIWNAHDNSYANPHIDDVSFISNIVDSLAASHQIDRTKVFVFGWSNGGFMANRLACEIPDKITAIYTLAGNLRDNLNRCSRSGEVAILHLHPTGDNTVPFVGDANRGYISAEEAINRWVNFNECDTTPLTVGPFDLTRDEIGEETNSYRYLDCQANVEFTVIDGSDHGPDFKVDQFHLEIVSFFERSLR